jgi:hypothetical protein
VTGRHVGSSIVEDVLPILCHHSLELPIESVACLLSGFVAAVSAVQIIKIPALTGAFMDRSFVGFVCCRLVRNSQHKLAGVLCAWMGCSLMLPTRWAI